MLYENAATYMAEQQNNTEIPAMNVYVFIDDCYSAQMIRLQLQ